MSLEPGSVVGGDFEIVAPLSSGGMGSVYVAQQRSVGRRRALKVMHRELLTDAKLRDRFVQEAKVGATIDSEHVVEVIAAGVDEKLGMPWLAMELLEGKDLAAIIDGRGSLPLKDVREVVDQLCHALAAAHAAGIVHRDLKPENVFVARARRRGGTPFVVKVLDFGIAKVMAEARATSAATAALGTPLYMAPEQTESRSKVAPPADVWALGLVVFRALTGKHFWIAAHDESASMTALMRELVLNPIPSASERAREHGVGAQIPAGFDEWFARCVERDPSRRFSDAGAAHEAFAEVRGDGQSTAGAIDEELRAPRRETPSLETPGERTEQRGETEVAVAVPAKTERRGETELGPPLSQEKAATGGARTIAAAPLVDDPPPKPIQPVKREPEAAPSRIGLIAGVAVAAVAAGGYMLTRGSEPASIPAASSSGQTAQQASEAKPVPATSASAAAGENPFIEVKLPSSPLALGVAGDEVKASTRGLRSSRHAMSPEAPYAIQAHEVSWAELDPWLASNASLRFKPPVDVPNDAAARGNLPATGVPWEVASAYCKSIGGSLPTEEQWEYAARGASRRAYAWGDTAVDVGATHAFAGPTGRVVAVMSSSQDVTPEGIHDLMGNAREWTSTLWREDTSGPAEGWVEDGATSARVVRGWPLRLDPPTSFTEVQAHYRDYACASGGCSPLHPDVKVKPPLLPFAVVSDASTRASPLRAWVRSPGFSDALGRCARGTKGDAPLAWKLRAEVKVLSCPKDALHGWYIPGDDLRGSTIFASEPAAADTDGDGIPNSTDLCPNDPEDMDGFKDSDGCPDPDNDGDGILDTIDKCTNVAGPKSNGGCPEEKPAAIEKPAIPEPPQPAPRGASGSGASGSCKPTSELVLSSKDMPAEVVKCLDQAAALMPAGSQAWNDEVVLRITRTALPAMLAETGFRCVAPR